MTQHHDWTGTNDTCNRCRWRLTNQNLRTLCPGWYVDGSPLAEDARTDQAETSQQKWDRNFLNLALHIAEWSKDRSRKIGCVIVRQATRAVLSHGYNGFPRGVNDNVPERHERPAKYLWTEHAERNAIYNAVREGIHLEGTTLYMAWYPCVECARAIVQSGIAELVCVEPDWNDPKYGEEFRTAKVLFEEARTVRVRFVQGYTSPRQK